MFKILSNKHKYYESALQIPQPTLDARQIFHDYKFIQVKGIERSDWIASLGLRGDIGQIFTHSAPWDTPESRGIFSLFWFFNSMICLVTFLLITVKFWTILEINESYSIFEKWILSAIILIRSFYSANILSSKPSLTWQKLQIRPGLSKFSKYIFIVKIATYFEQLYVCTVNFFLSVKP